jgi:hypothetical protein
MGHRIALLAVIAVGLVPPGAADARTPCSRAAYREIARSAQAVVLARRGDAGVKAGCLLKRDKLLYLSDPVDDWVSHVTVAGHMVAFFDHYVDGAPTGAEGGHLRVVDVARRKGVFWDRVTGFYTDGGPNALARMIRLKSNGSVAWTTCPWHSSEDVFGEPLVCDRPGPDSTFQVAAHSAMDTAAARTRILDEGPDVNPRSLRLRGSTLTWMHDGAGTQTARLR